jgi:hypothetical protein
MMLQDVLEGALPQLFVDLGLVIVIVGKRVVDLGET